MAPIFYARCTTCHRPGRVGPMSLPTCADARPWARSIRQKVVAREMPPWDADPAIGAWADGGAPHSWYLIDGEAQAGSTQEP